MRAGMREPATDYSAKRGTLHEPPLRCPRAPETKLSYGHQAPLRRRPSRHRTRIGTHLRCQLKFLPWICQRTRTEELS